MTCYGLPADQLRWSKMNLHQLVYCSGWQGWMDWPLFFVTLTFWGLALSAKRDRHFARAFLYLVPASIGTFVCLDLFSLANGGPTLP
jgi:hypothetical protein